MFKHLLVTGELLEVFLACLFMGTAVRNCVFPGEVLVSQEISSAMARFHL